MASCIFVPTSKMLMIPRTFSATNIQVMRAYSQIPSKTQNIMTEQIKGQKGKFSPKRSRDTSAAQLSLGNSQKSQNANSSKQNSHINAYDQSNTCSLSSAMQTTVPLPFKTVGSVDSSRSGHLNMPGGQWAQSEKYISGDLQDHHQNTASLKSKKKNMPTRNTVKDAE